MKTVFADTGYWIAILDPKDTLHQKAIELSCKLPPIAIYTSEMVLTEVLNHFAKGGSALRLATVAFIEAILEEPTTIVVPQTQVLFQQAFTLYQARPDQAWSHTDCASFCIMEQQNILEALAYDKHFKQAGFIPLLRES